MAICNKLEVVFEESEGDTLPARWMPAVRQKADFTPRFQVGEAVVSALSTRRDVEIQNT